MSRAERERSTVEVRLDRLENLLHDVKQALDLNAKRLNAVQAQLDHLTAKSRTI